MSAERATVVVVDDDQHVLELLRIVLGALPYDTHAYASPTQALAGMATHGVDVLVTDLCMPDMSGVELVQAVRERWPHCRSVVLTGYGTVPDAVRAMKAGASEFLAKPVDTQRLLTIVSQLTGQRSTSSETDRNMIEVFWGKSDTQGLALLAQRTAPTNATVLISGETGVGKEVLADYIQAHSLRARQPYVKVNCAALSETLIESELFGHERGSFTGANDRHIGRFERANGGTLFLDEIGELPPGMQGKLLRVLQAQEIERVGGEETIKVNFRLLCATCRDLSAMVAQGTFRQDLFFRINVVPMHIPPLRERPDVIPQLARLLLRRLRAALTQGPVDIDPDAMALLQKQPWSGNIRELEHSLERACVLVGGPSLRASDLTWLGNPAAALLSGVSAGPWFPPQPPDNAVDISGPPLSPLDEAERKALQHVLEQHRWNFTRAATALQISRSSLYMKAKRYGLTRTANLLASESASLPVVGSV